jgi:hypothetical protein
LEREQGDGEKGGERDEAASSPPLFPLSNPRACFGRAAGPAPKMVDLSSVADEDLGDLIAMAQKAIS